MLRCKETVPAYDDKPGYTSLGNRGDVEVKAGD